MRVLKPLAWFLAAFFLTVYAGLASAAAPISHWNSPDFPSAKWTSPDEGCTALIGKYNAANPPPKSQAFCRPPHSEVYVNWFNPSQGNTDYRIYKQSVCADGSKPNIYVSLNLQCPDTPPPDNCPPMDHKSETTYVVSQGGKDIYSPLDPGASARNSAGCKVDATEVVECYSLPKSNDPTKEYCTYVTQQTGGVANESPMPVSPHSDKEKDRGNTPPVTGKDDGSCPRGTVNVGLSASGIPMCVGQGTKPASTPAAPPKVEVEKNEPTSDGGTKNTKTETVTNADGSTTKTTTVTITGPTGEKSTNQEKETTKTPSGAVGKESKPDDKSDLCKQNPNLTICMNSTVSGKCAETACTGDAIQCATLRAAAAMQCQQDKEIEVLTKLPSTSLGNSILSGSDPMKGAIDTAMKGTEIDLSKPGLDQSGFIGGGSCLPNKTMTVMGRSVTVQFAQLCSNIQPLRGVVMACAFILAYMIVSRSVLQG